MNNNWEKGFHAWMLTSLERMKSPSSYRNFSNYIRIQNKSLDEILTLNWEKRKRLLVYSFQTIPFYRTSFMSAGIQQRDLVNPEVWSFIPILSKRDIVEHFDMLKKPGLTTEECYISVTGGSTGQPLKVLHDASFQHNALGWRMLKWWGLPPGTDEGRIWRFSPTPTPLPWRSVVKKYVPALKKHVVRLDASYMDNDSIQTFITEWNIVRPPLLTGYVGAVHHVACFIQQHGLRVHQPQAVWVTSAPLSTGYRAIIENAFQAPVYDQYGSCEVYWLAAECRCRHGLHMFVDARYLEFVTEAGKPCPPDVFGRILVTDLENMVFPLIRYEIGDIGRQLSRTCTCGVNLPLMDAVKGRISDKIKLKDGSVVSGEYLTTIFDDYPGVVNAFQIRQCADYSIKIRVVPNTQCGQLKDIVQRVQAALVTKIRAQVPVDVVYVDDIPANCGKTRYVVSEVPVE